MSKKKPIDPKAIELLGKAHRGEIPLVEALVGLGISDKQAYGKGWSLVQTRASLRGALAAAKAEEAKNFIANAPDLTADEDVKMVNARLRQNIIAGEDKGVQSAKLLGSRRDLNMFTPDSNVGIIIMEMPKNLPPLPDYIEGVAPRIPVEKTTKTNH
jgi:hypothetical protein